MPNHCSNWIKISGSKELLDQIISKPFNLDTYCPIPSDLNYSDKRDWIEENWGTKWIDDNIIFTKNNNNELETFFTSAWGPPISFYIKLIEIIPEIVIEYEYSEYMMTFAGYGIISKNKINNIYEHYIYENKEELNTIMNIRKWNLDINSLDFE